MNQCLLASYIIFTFSHQNNREQGIKGHISFGTVFHQASVKRA